MEKFKLTDLMKKVVSKFTEKNYVANNGSIMLELGCNPCSGSCGGNCSGSCAGSCRGNCTFTCSRYTR